MNIEVSALLPIVNQLFDLERKLDRLPDGKPLNRNLRRMRESLEDLGISYHNPLGESFDETRTDCEASITGTQTENLVITEVIKPIVHLKEEGYLQLIQNGVVIVSAK